MTDTEFSGITGFDRSVLFVGFTTEPMEDCLDFSPPIKYGNAKGEKRDQIIAEKTEEFRNNCKNYPYMGSIGSVYAIYFPFDSSRKVYSATTEIGKGKKKTTFAADGIFQFLKDVKFFEEFPTVCDAPFSEEVPYIYGFGARDFCKILSVELRTRMTGINEVPVTFWRRNRNAYDPYEECVSYEDRSKVSLSKVLDIANIDWPGRDSGELYETGNNAENDCLTSLNMVAEYGLIGIQ